MILHLTSVFIEILHFWWAENVLEWTIFHWMLFRWHCVLTTIFAGICVFNETRVFSSFRDLPIWSQFVWNGFGNIWTFSETFGTLRSISITFGPFEDDLTSRSCSSNHAVKISVSIIIGWYGNGKFWCNQFCRCCIHNISCEAKVLWVVDSLLSRLGFLLGDDKTPRCDATVGRWKGVSLRGETTNLGLLVFCLWFVFGLVKSTTYGTN